MSSATKQIITHKRLKHTYNKVVVTEVYEAVSLD